MQRRKLLQTFITATASAPLLTVAGTALAASSPAPKLQLDSSRWSPLNATRIQSVIEQFGSSSKTYDQTRRPYVVFDWDNTCIMNDCEEALFMHQINHLSFKLTPVEFAEVLRKGLPGGPFKAEAGHVTVDAKPVKMEDIADDVEADYRSLYAAKQANKSLDDIRQSEIFKDFRAKLYFMYDAICDSYPIEIGYKWVIYFFANMKPAEVQAMAEESNNRALGDGLRKTKYESSREIPGKAGVVVATHFHGLRIHEEMRILMHTFRANGIDVFVSTASLDDVVRVFASHPNYGYGVPPENVIGLRLEMTDGKYTNTYRQGWHFNWGPGKTIGIQNELVSKKGYDPLVVFGDSDGDAWMLRDFKGTQLGVIVNRMKKGEIGVDSQMAATSLGRRDARFILQGRDENTGLMLPDEKSIKYGKVERKLLA
ncbi:haloacid dehalogenase-like hydrolase [Undibacterium sp. Jales W-56]|uniref:haloacid dehalogenase-like hydrolase n=1 Tax=Undibacterium sp. Jales W-56 TaxID=2897325 RepID=UPI0021CE7B42|nr:haloacid dehalogenase-like hydrolase [Undibacterium sp. Jales W-56]MCU6435179.1 haloacid dehalogenase-like hydrolase [Undibacterium sp. Jales W-56]